MTVHSWLRFLTLLCLGLILVPEIATAQLSKGLQAELETELGKFEEITDPVVRQTNLLTRAQMGGRDNLAVIEAARQDDDPRVRLMAVFARQVAQVRGAAPVAADALAEQSNIERTLREVLSMLPARHQVLILSEYLGKVEIEGRRPVYAYLTQSRGPQLDLLLEEMKRERSEDDVRAIGQALIRRPRAQARDALLVWVRSGSPIQQRTAVEVAIGWTYLENLRDPGAEVLVAALGSQIDNVRGPAIDRLAALGNRAAFDWILENLTRLEAGQQAVRIQQLLDSQIRPSMERVRDLPDQVDPANKPLAMALLAATRDEATVKKLVQMNQSTTFEERMMAVTALGYSQSDEAAGILHRTVFEGRKDVRLASVRGLGVMGRDDSVRPLEQVVSRDQDPEVRLEAIKALGNIRTPASLQVLRFLVTNRDPRIKLETLTSIRRIGLPEGANALDVLLRDTNLEIQWKATITLMELDPARGRTQFASAMRNPPDTFITDVFGASAQARNAMVEWLLTNGSGTALMQVVDRAIRTRTFTERLGAIAFDTRASEGLRANILNHLAEEGQLAAAEKAAREGSPNFARSATWTLIHYGSKAQEPVFRGLLGHADAAVRAAATLGLARIHS